MTGDAPNHPRQQVDLLLGTTLAEWVLATVSLADVGTVWTDEPATVGIAQQRGFRVQGGRLGAGPTRRAIGVHYPRVLAADELDGFEAVYNLHPGFLPWGRGYYPYLWAIVADEPAGATLHRMTPQLDRGPIVAQERVPVHPADTAGTLIERIREAERRLFSTWWPRIVAGEPIPELAQPPGGSYHARSDAELWRGRPDDRARRAFTF